MSGHEDVILPGVVVMAGARLDKHHLPFEDLTLRTLELNINGGGGVGRAAASVNTASTELGLVESHTGAACELEPEALGGTSGPDALFTFLKLVL